MTKKLTIEEMRRIARERGGSCLSTEYVNAMGKLKWRCKVGHESVAFLSNLRKRTWYIYFVLNR
jgi:hypothetical protein